ncbi:MAG: UDP-N-acetylglucosamine 2-epimerase (non-hydrolyzing) [Sedimentisphaerales bacterium]|nr:UDP-N-acetylglucosamine 2-epimerase (non-hydrolyzing) [Sedimentisphaerales bacterium]
MKRVSFIFGTRPEAIKLCPLILAMRKTTQLCPHVCVTGQHREMLYQVLEAFDVVPDVDLELMEPNQTLVSLTSKAIFSIDEYLNKKQPDLVLVQGDTTSVFCASLAAYYHQIPVGHVEAGLRTGNKYSPYPEEINRILTTHLSDYHFAPTEISRKNLLKEGVHADRVFVTGNTVIDALYLAVQKVASWKPLIPGVPSDIFSSERPVVLITGHRRENFREGFEAICKAISTLAKRFQEVVFIYPVHLNPNVREPVLRLLNGFSNILLIEPLGYLPFVALMNRSVLILTDSGGVQEEAPSLGKPVLVMRETTERPEAVEAGTVKLVGACYERIVEQASSLLMNKDEYECMARSINPYGDGKACERIIDILCNAL